MKVDVLVIGAGAAGLMCAIEAGKRGRKVLVLDHMPKLGGKILISGGGRCNFTNVEAGPANYVSKNPHFCKSALSRYPAAQFIELVERHGIAFHEKKLGQLFCDDSAKQIVDLLCRECEWAGVEIRLSTVVQEVNRPPAAADGYRFCVKTAREEIFCRSLVIATGGLSIPKIGATGVGYAWAKSFGIPLVDRAAALDGFIFDSETSAVFRELAGLSVDCVIESGGLFFRENILFTHSGLSGPAALQASLHWREKGQPIKINLLPEQDAFTWFRQKKRDGATGRVKNLLAELLPARLSEAFCARTFDPPEPLPLVSERALENFCRELHAWTLFPAGTVGYGKAEVTRGGVDTDALSSQTMEARAIPGLFFVGEVVDVTGWLGGYNFQWAWASGWAAGQFV